MEEKLLSGKSGIGLLLLDLLGIILGIAGFVIGLFIATESGLTGLVTIGVLLAIVGGIMGFLVCPILMASFKVLKPNEALVLTLFGKYYGTLRGPGLFAVNPFVSAINTTKGVDPSATAATGAAAGISISTQNLIMRKSDTATGKKISLKVMTLNNDKQKVNDKMGNPVEIGVVVIWKVINTAQAVFDVDNYMEFLSIQADSALRNIVRMYPYDISDDDGDTEGELSLRGSSLEVAKKLKEELQEKVTVAGLEIVEAKITHLAYAPEIAAAMLQRQQASAIVDARKLIVEGAVGMVQMALTQLSEEKIVELDDERKAAMVSNLLVVLCGNRDAQPIVNSGSIY
ncbi:MAG: SPFH domain-containing protein [Oscillospiraceae bacterium]